MTMRSWAPYRTVPGGSACLYGGTRGCGRVAVCSRVAARARQPLRRRAVATAVRQVGSGMPYHGHRMHDQNGVCHGTVRHVGSVTPYHEQKHALRYIIVSQQQRPLFVALRRWWLAITVRVNGMCCHDGHT